jgi:hypothetical protein
VRAGLRFGIWDLGIDEQWLNLRQLVIDSSPTAITLMKATLLLTLIVFIPLIAFAQQPAAPPVGGEFQITKITKNLISAPLFTYAGGQQYPTNQRDRWLEIEVEFAAVPRLTDELTLKYYILFNGSVLTGEVTHANVSGGREKRSVMYVSPRTLARFADNRPITTNSFPNIAVQITQQGAVKAEASLARAQPGWFTTVPQVSGVVLRKGQTPFAPLYWDRYEEIKSSP